MFCYVIFALLGWMIYILHNPVPKGLSNQWKTWIQLAMVKLFFKIADGIHYLGIKTWYDLLNDLGKNAPLSKISTVKRQMTTWNGVPVWVYTPDKAQPNGPAIFFIHGGGWTLGGPRQYDGYTMHLSRDTNFVVFSIDYRLAPKHIHPAQLDDCVTAYQYLIGNAKEFDIDPTRIVVMGDSAGGQLTTTLSLTLRDKYSELQKPKLQVMIYPAVQLVDYDLPSYQANANGCVITRYRVQRFASLYLEGHENNLSQLVRNNHVCVATRKKLSESYLNHSLIPQDRYPKNYSKPHWGLNVKESTFQKIALDPYVSPLLSENLKDLPKAYVFACAHDVLRDDGILYHDRLRKAGNDATLHIMEEGYHAIMSRYWESKEAKEHHKRITDYILSNI